MDLAEGQRKRRTRPAFDFSRWPMKPVEEVWGPKVGRFLFVMFSSFVEIAKIQTAKFAKEAQRTQRKRKTRPAFDFSRWPMKPAEEVWGPNSRMPVFAKQKKMETRS